MLKQEDYIDEFDEWATLAEEDPAAFERMRLALVERFISEAPPERRERLRCLQWRIEKERALSKTPLGACIRLSRMMWGKVLDRGGLVDQLQQLGLAMKNSPMASGKTGRILPFASRAK